MPVTRYDYATGYRSREAAQESLEDGFASGDVMEGERPRIEPYRNARGLRRYKITLES
ncbi:hypothetical protein KM176_16550 [Pseudooceanicola sp. CBS1P-1]|uniref:SPOR domain-containing protein n=1 Tax=Pseudooceanicola albus TaxID=2692189 RepID=A0A6L7G613_9RHOB|nr:MULTISPECIES: hypothetical protein [Pseudooceanicola]MBT9385486.1 hypothetical protein [Pseudooceanicola endophyticus]MXN19102.1 hypothetical protein [Pseudooceanicola albus]